MNTKICRSCNLLLDIGQFHKNSNYDDGYLTRCKTCRETLVGKVARQRQMNMKRDLVRRSKDKPCMDCGQSFPTECMDFDHRLNKLFNIGQSLARYGLLTIENEIAKCDVVCACCHRIRSAIAARSKKS